MAGRSQRGETLLESQLRNLVPPDARLFCEPKVYVETGPPAERILALAEELGTDLIVLGVKRSAVGFRAIGAPAAGHSVQGREPGDMPGADGARQLV